MAGENFDKFGKSEAIRQSFTHPNLHFKKLRIVDYQKFTGKNARDVYLEILSSFEGKPGLPDPSGPLKEIVPPTAIAEANVKVNEAKFKKSASWPMERTHF